jgi:hypothetical protein
MAGVGLQTMRVALAPSKTYIENGLAVGRLRGKRYAWEGAAIADTPEPGPARAAAVEVAPAPRRSDDPDRPGSMALNPSVIGSVDRPPMPESQARKYLTSEMIDEALANR